MRTKRIAYWLFWTALSGLLAAAGCTVKNKGTPHANQPPKVFFSTIPVSGTTFTKPDRFFWYATDRDGYIIEFQYALQPDSLVGIARSGAKADSAVRAFLAAHPMNTDTATWHWKSVDNIIRNGQTDTIALPTSRQDTLTINTVVFVRARDDRGVLSTDPISKATSFSTMDSLSNLNPSAIAYRLFGRKNRPPRTHFRSIGVCNKNQVSTGLPTFYSLDANTYDSSAFMKVGHCGITVRWIGSDSLDYPNQTQPSFDYFWELFGPFPTRSVFADTNRLWASATYPGRYPGGGAPRTARTFTPVTSVTFFGLRGNDTLENYQPGFYQFRVRSRDDAGVLDPVGGSFTFRVIHPRFDRSILLVMQQTDPIGDARPLPADSMKVQNYYVKLIRDARYGAEGGNPLHFDSAQDLKFFPRGHDLVGVPESLLSRYKLVIFHKENCFASIGKTDFLDSLKGYLDAGGKAWGMGREDLSDLTPLFNVGRPVEIPFNRTSPTFGVGYFYFGAEKMFFNAHVETVRGDSVSREEFIGAEPLLAGLPVLDIDTALVQSLPVDPIRKDTSGYRQLPGVNYFVRGPRSENLYLYRSPIGVADTSHLNGKVVALRSDKIAFKSSYFGFPLYFIREPGATEVVRQMLDWFIGPP